MLSPKKDDQFILISNQRIQIFKRRINIQLPTQSTNTPAHPNLTTIQLLIHHLSNQTLSA